MRLKFELATSKFSYCGVQASNQEAVFYFILNHAEHTVMCDMGSESITKSWATLAFNAASASPISLCVGVDQGLSMVGGTNIRHSSPVHLEIRLFRLF